MNTRLFLYAFTAALGGLLFGFDTAVISGTTEMITAHFSMSEADLGWAVSSALVGCVIGAIAVGKPGDLFGRRLMLFVTAVLYFASAVWTGATDSYTGFILARILGGFGVGAASVMAPMYISEISPPRIRGRLVSTAQLAIVTGIVVAFFSNYLLSEPPAESSRHAFWAAYIGEHSWRFMFWAEAVPAAVYFVMLFFVCESPRWLVKVGRVDEARDVIRTVDPEEDAERVLAEIKQSLTHEEDTLGAALFRAPYLKLVLIGIFVGAFNQLTGINVVMYYAPKIFKSAGFAEGSALLQTVAVGGTNLVFTLVGMALIDKLGRKTLLLIGSLGMPACLGLVAFGLQRQIQGSFLLVAMLGFVVFFCTTQGVVIWVILSEMFPNRIRARCTAIGSFAVWVVNAVTAFLFPIASARYGTGPVFAFYAAATLASFPFFWKYLVETKGRTLEEIEGLVLGGKEGRGSGVGGGGR
jgi:sugar porter (SP) family MFS transporter